MINKKNLIIDSINENINILTNLKKVFEKLRNIDILIEISKSCHSKQIKDLLIQALKYSEEILMEKVAYDENGILKTLERSNLKVEKFLETELKERYITLKNILFDKYNYIYGNENASHRIICQYFLIPFGNFHF